MSGTASAMVAMATILMNDGRSRSRPVASISACATLKATPAPQSDLHGIFASGLVGIQNGQCLRNAFVRFGQMMVGDDEIHANAFGCVGGGEGANAGVDGDDQANPGFGGALDHVVLHAVALFDPVRDVELRGAAAEFDHGFQDDDGGGAVDVVVAVDEDVFFLGDGGLQALDGGLHAEHQVRRMQMRELRREKAIGLFRTDDTAGGQESRNDGGQL